MLVFYFYFGWCLKSCVFLASCFRLDKKKMFLFYFYSGVYEFFLIIFQVNISKTLDIVSVQHSLVNKQYIVLIECYINIVQKV